MLWPFASFGPYGLDPLLILTLALVLEPVLGEARGPLARLPHPVRLLGRIIDALDRRLNRPQRSDRDRRIRGGLVVLVVTALAAAVGVAVTAFAQAVPYGFLAELVLTIVLLAQRSLYRHVAAVGCGLREAGLTGGRDAVAHIVGRDVAQLDDHGVARAAIESCAENYADGIVAPTVFALVFGLPGLCAYKAINTLDSMIGHRNEQYRAFGMAAARLDDLANLVPARLAGLYLTLAALVVPTARPLAATRIMLRDASRHRSPNAGWPEGAMAGALGLALAGPRRYPGYVVEDPWIGDGTAQATERDIRRALYILVVACLINGLVAAAVAVVRLNHTG